MRLQANRERISQPQQRSSRAVRPITRGAAGTTSVGSGPSKIETTAWEERSSYEEVLPDIALNGTDPYMFDRPATSSSVRPFPGPRRNPSRANYGIIPGKNHYYVLGAEWLSVRPHFGNASAFNQRTQFNASGTTTNVEQSFDFDFGYDNSVRTFFSIVNPDQQSALKFTFWRMDGQAQLSARTPGSGVSYFGYFGEQLNQTGDSITAQLEVDAFVYDLEFVKSLRALLGSTCDDPACRSWDIQGSVAVRIADIDRRYQAMEFNPAGAQLLNGTISADFLGGGPRLGIEAYRFLDPQRHFALGLKSSYSLLLGNSESDLISVDSSGSTTVVNMRHSQQTKTVPVLEMEVSASWLPTPVLAISGGWMYQVWYDLGLGQDISNSFGATNFSSSNDGANTLSFDGFFLRLDRQF